MHSQSETSLLASSLSFKGLNLIETYIFSSCAFDTGLSPWVESSTLLLIKPISESQLQVHSYPDQMQMKRTYKLIKQTTNNFYRFLPLWKREELIHVPCIGFEMAKDKTTSPIVLSATKGKEGEKQKRKTVFHDNINTMLRISGSWNQKMDTQVLHLHE